MDMMNVDGFIDGTDIAMVATMTSHGDEDGDDDGHGNDDEIKRLRRCRR